MGIGYDVLKHGKVSGMKREGMDSLDTYELKRTRRGAW